jgi:hypothetical protein
MARSRGNLDTIDQTQVRELSGGTHATQFMTTDGSALATGNILTVDANGNVVDSGIAATATETGAVFGASGSGHAPGAVPDPGSSAGSTRFLCEDATWAVPPGTGSGSGSVTSVALTVPSWLSVSGSPVTTSGTLAITATTGETANQFLATPNGSTGAVGLRTITAADLPLATTGAFGAVKPDGTTITISGGVITSTSSGGMTNPMTTAGDVIYGGTSGTPTRLAGGTSGYVLTSNGATSAPSWQAWSGGSSGVLYGTRASLPGTIPASGTEYKCTDSPYSYISNGTAWLAFFMGMPVTEPVTGNFSWYNQSTAAVDTTYGGERLSIGSSGSTGFVTRGKSYPGTAFTQTFGFLLQGANNALHIRNATPNLMDWRVNTDGAFTIGWDLWTSPNSPSGGSQIQSPSSLYPIWGPILFLRFQDDGTNRSLSYSADNKFFIVWRTESRTASMTPTIIGYGTQGSSTCAWLVHDSLTTP